MICRGDKVNIPGSLRSVLLDILHSAHQGVSGMEARAAISAQCGQMKGMKDNLIHSI